MFMHFVGGFWFGLLFIFLTHKYISLNINLKKLLLFVLILGIGFEIYEIIIDRLITLKGLDYVDSLSDLFFDLLGGLISYFYYYKRIFVNTENKI
mgnify:FL=1